jgi:hypothetical protein
LQNTVSASRLSLFLQCRLKFYFRYVLKIKKPKTASLHVGNSVHSALKAWNKARWLNKPLSLKGLHDEFTKAWADTSEGSVPWEAGEEDERKQQDGDSVIPTFGKGVMANIKPDAVEVSIEADLSNTVFLASSVFSISFKRAGSSTSKPVPRHPIHPLSSTYTKPRQQLRRPLSPQHRQKGNRHRTASPGQNQKPKALHH